MEHTRLDVCGSIMDILGLKGIQYMIGVQISKVLQRETFNLYRSFKLKKIPFIRATTSQIDYLIEVGAVPGSTHSITLVPIESGIPYVQEVLNQQKTGRGLTGRKPRRLLEGNIKIREGDHDAEGTQANVSPIRMLSTSSLPASPSNASPSSPLFDQSPSPMVLSPVVLSPSLLTFSSSSCPDLPITLRRKKSTNLNNNTSPSLSERTSPCSSPQISTQRSSPLLSLLSVGLEIDKARIHRRKPAPWAISRSLKKQDLTNTANFMPLQFNVSVYVC